MNILSIETGTLRPVQVPLVWDVLWSRSEFPGAWRRRGPSSPTACRNGIGAGSLGWWGLVTLKHQSRVARPCSHSGHGSAAAGRPPCHSLSGLGTRVPMFSSQQLPRSLLLLLSSLTTQPFLLEAGICPWFLVILGFCFVPSFLEPFPFFAIVFASCFCAADSLGRSLNGLRRAPSSRERYSGQFSHQVTSSQMPALLQSSDGVI